MDETIIANVGDYLVQETDYIQIAIRLLVVTCLFSPGFSWAEPAVSDKEVIGRVGRIIEENQMCTDDADCIAIELGCPFGCNAKIINRRSQSDLMLEANKIAGRCQYDCGDSSAHATCKNNKCVRSPDGSSNK